MRVARHLVFVIPLLAGCQAMFFGVSDKKKPVAAEFNRIGDKRVAVLVWAEPATLDMDALARHRVAAEVKYYMEQHLPKARFVEPMVVSRFQEQSGLDWESMSPAALCKEFDCGLLLRIDLLQYTTRAPEARELRKGNVTATINLYSAGEGDASESLYHSTVTVEYPTDGSIGVLDRSDQQILTETVRQFGQAVAKKFYDHEEPYLKTDHE